MTIKKKVEKSREQVIARGGAVTDCVIIKDERTQLCLSLSHRLLDRVNLAVKDREGLSRNAWILEAIQDKLKGNE
jgi:hypothetical protein